MKKLLTFLLTVALLTAQGLDNGTSNEATNTDAEESEMFIELEETDAPTDADADTQEQGQGEERSFLPDSDSGVLRAVITAAFFLIVLYVIFMYIRRKSVKMSGVSGELIKVLATQNIAPNKYICLVEIAGRVYAVGVSESSISYITEINDKDEADYIKVQASKADEQTKAGFGGLLDKLLDGLNVKPEKKKKPLERTDELNERLKKMNGFYDDEG